MIVPFLRQEAHLMDDRKPCLEWMELLVIRNQADLSSDDREALNAHLAHCPSCVAAYERYQRMALRLRALPPVEPLPDFTPQLIRLKGRIHGERNERIPIPLSEKKINSVDSHKMMTLEDKEGRIASSRS